MSANINPTEPAVISTRVTFDNVTVYLHEDGSVSDRLRFCRSKLPTNIMWSVWAWVETYRSAELPQLIKSARAGKWSPKGEAA
jgi:hypothetical protein